MANLINRCSKNTRYDEGFSATSPLKKKTIDDLATRIGFRPTLSLRAPHAGRRKKDANCAALRISAVICTRWSRLGAS